MKNLGKVIVMAAMLGGAALMSQSAQAFWGPFDWFDDGPGWGGPWGGGPWSGGPWGYSPYYGGYPYYGGGYPYYGGGYPNYGGYGYPGYGTWGYPYTVPAAPAAEESK